MKFFSTPCRTVLLASALISSLTIAPARADDPSPAPAAPTADPKWWETMLAREGAPVAAHEVVGVDGAFRANPDATVAEPPKVVSPGIQNVLLSIGSERPMACQVFTTEAVGLADSAFGMAGQILADLEKQAGSQLSHNIYHLDVGSYGPVPYALMEVVYTAGAAKDTDSGHLKVAVATRGQRSVMCSHVEIGYSQTFTRVFQSLATTLDVKGAAASPVYTRITTLAANGQRFAVSREEYFAPSGGRVVYSHQVSTLLGLDPTNMRSSEEGTIEVTGPDGALIKATAATSANGREVSNLTLQPDTAHKGWTISGTYDGTAAYSAAHEDEPLSSALGRVRAARALIAGQKVGAAREYTLWRGTRGPTTFSHLKLEAKSFTADGMSAVEAPPAPRPAARPVPRATPAAPASAENVVQFSRTGIEKPKPSGQMGAVTVNVAESYVHGVVPAP